MKKNINVKKMNFVISICILFVCIFFSSLQIFSIESADGETSYEITNYDSKIEVLKEHKYNIETNLDVRIFGPVNSIEFALPNGSFSLTELKLNGNVCSESERIITIKEPEELSIGEHSYKIQYSISEYEERGEIDKFYFEVLPSAWMHEISKLRIEVAFPDDFPVSEVESFAGQFGVQNINNKISLSKDEIQKKIQITAVDIPENFGIIIKTNLPKEYWQGALNGDWAIKLMLIVSLTVVLIILFMWIVGGQDPKFEKVLQAYPIEGLSPVEINYAANGRVRMRDVISLIVYFAIKGYLKISEYQPKKYRLIKLSEPKSQDEEKYIRTAFDLLFEDIPQGRWIEVESIGSRLRKIMESLKRDVAAGFSDDNMQTYTKQSRIFRTVGIIVLLIAVFVITLTKYLYTFNSVNLVDITASMLIFGILLIMICYLFDSRDYSKDNNLFIKFAITLLLYLLSITIIVLRTMYMTKEYSLVILSGLLILVSTFFVIIMLARTKGNAELSSKISQLRHFIYHPDARVLLNAYMENENYYYEMLPYALSFKGLETWAISFLTLDVKEPDWYSEDIEGNAYANLNKSKKTVVDYAKDLKAFARAVGNTYHSMDRQGLIIWEINKK